MNLKLSLIIIAFLAVAFLSYPVNGESGNITVTSSSNEPNYQVSERFNGVGATNFTVLVFDTAHYNSISEFDVYFNGQVNYATNGQSGSFTCVSGCVLPAGTFGAMGYSKIADLAFWDFPSGTTVNSTNSLIVLSYSTNFFNSDITPKSGVWIMNDTTATDLGSTRPVGIYCFGVAAVCNNPPSVVNNIISTQSNSGNPPLFFNASVGTTATNHYNISYTTAGKQLFITNISKSAYTNILTNIVIQNASGTPVAYPIQGDVTGNFNVNNWAVTNTYGQGIALNMSISSGGGAFNIFVINSTGSTITTPTNGSAGTFLTPCTKPSSGANVCFDKSSYTVGDNVNVTWFLSDSTQSDLFNKKLRMTLNGVPLNTGSVSCGGCIDITAQNGFYIAQATSPGVFEADVLEGIIQYTNIGSNTVVINAPSNSWIAVANTTMYTRTLNNVTYHIGYSVATYPAAAIEIDINDVATGNLIDVLFPTVFPDGTMTFGAVHPIPVGNYSVRLIDDVKNQVLDTKYFTAIPSPLGVPVAGIKTSSITTDKSTYFYNDYMQVSYQVDDTNFSNFNYTLMAHIIALDHGNITTKMFITPFADQVGTFTSIVNINKNMRCDKGLNCWFETGNNSINLVLMNTTTGTANAITLAFANFTVSSTTVDGYGLSLSTTTPNTNEVFTATSTVPAGHTGFVSVSNAGTKKSIFVYNQTVGNAASLVSTIQTFPITIQPINSNPVAYYVVDLIGDDNLTKVSIPITVTQTTPKTWTGTWTAPQGNIGATCSFVDGWVNLMFGSSMGLNDVSRQAFAFVWIVLFLVVPVLVTKNISTGIVVAFLPYSFFLILTLTTPCGTYMPTWTAVFIALILVIKSRWL